MWVLMQIMDAPGTVPQCPTTTIDPYWRASYALNPISSASLHNMEK
jgi:hypothetical protein